VFLTLTINYSNNKKGKEYNGINRERSEDLNILELTPGEHIDHITIYEGYRNITNLSFKGKLPYIIVGIYFKMNHNQEILYGSTNGIQKKKNLLRIIF